jgi:hypothetical protein
VHDRTVIGEVPASTLPRGQSKTLKRCRMKRKSPLSLSFGIVSQMHFTN